MRHRALSLAERCDRACRMPTNDSVRRGLRRLKARLTDSRRSAQPPTQRLDEARVERIGVIDRRKVDTPGRQLQNVRFRARPRPDRGRHRCSRHHDAVRVPLVVRVNPRVRSVPAASCSARIADTGRDESTRRAYAGAFARTGRRNRWRRRPPRRGSPSPSERPRGAPAGTCGRPRCGCTRSSPRLGRPRPRLRTSTAST